MQHRVTAPGVFLLVIAVSSLLLFPCILDLELLPRLLVASLGMAILFCMFFIRYRRLNISADPVLIFYAFYTLYCLASVTWSLNKAEALLEADRACLAFFVFILTFLFLKKQGHNFLNSILKLSVFICAIELIAAFYQLASLPNLQKETMYKLTAFNAHKNLLASFLFLQCGMLAAGALRLTRYWKTAALICFVSSLVVIAMLRTKAVWLGIATAVLLYIILHFFVIKKKWFANTNAFVVILIFALAANLFFVWAFPQLIKLVLEHGLTLKNPVLDIERLTVWDKTYQLVAKKPLTGCGAGNWHIFFPDATLTGLWRAEDLNITFQRPHNDFLWILSELGIGGFNLFLLFLVSLFVFSIKATALRRNDINKARHIILFISVAAGFFTVSFFDFPKERIEHLVWINITLAILYFYVKSSGQLKKIFSFICNKMVYSACLLLLLFIFCVGLLRFKGEYYTRKMYGAKDSGNTHELIISGKEAISFAYCIDPASVPIHWYTGYASASEGNYAAAKKDLLIAYKYSPYNRKVLNDLATVYVFNEESDSAEKFYEESARISPRFDDPKLNLAALYLDENNAEKALYWLGTLFHDSPRRSEYTRKARALKETQITK